MSCQFYSIDSKLSVMLDSLFRLYLLHKRQPKSELSNLAETIRDQNNRARSRRTSTAIPTISTEPDKETLIECHHAFGLPKFIAELVHYWFRIKQDFADLVHQCVRIDAQYIPVLDWMESIKGDVVDSVTAVRDVIAYYVIALGGGDDKESSAALPHMFENPDEIHFNLIVNPGDNNQLAERFRSRPDLTNAIFRTKPRPSQVTDDSDLLSSYSVKEMCNHVPFLWNIIMDSGFSARVLVSNLNVLIENLKHHTEKAGESRQHFILARKPLNHLLGWNSIYGHRMRQQAAPAETSLPKPAAPPPSATSLEHISPKRSRIVDEEPLPVKTLPAMMEEGDYMWLSTTLPSSNGAAMQVKIKHGIRSGSRHDGAYCVSIEGTLYFMKIYVQYSAEQLRNLVEIHGRLKAWGIPTDIRALGTVVAGSTWEIIPNCTIVMTFSPWVEATSLHERYMPSPELLTLAERKRWMFDVLLGLYTMHRNGLAHKDIHVQNILVEKGETDDETRAVLIDLDSSIRIPTGRSWVNMCHAEVKEVLAVFHLAVPMKELLRVFPLWDPARILSPSINSHPRNAKFPTRFDLLPSLEVVDAPTDMKDYQDLLSLSFSSVDMYSSFMESCS